MRPTFLAGLAGLIVLVPQPAAPQTARLADDAKVAEALEVMRVWLEAERAYDRIPGISAALVHDQELLWSGGYGHAHPDRQVPATAETLYSICSISKLFTSIALMQLRDRGRFRLSDPVGAHLPWFGVRQAYEDGPPITIEGILTHAAGLPRESAHAYWSAPDFAFPTREQIIARLTEQETLYPAWQYFQYSNLGLTLAGELVRELSGTAYDEYVRHSVLGPLGLHDTYPDMPAEHRDGRLATGHSALDREGVRRPTPFFMTHGIAPAAGFASTVDDLARFASWQFRLEGNADEVLHAHTLREMQRVHYVDPEWNTFWGLGFSISRHDNRTFVGHGGSCPGYRSQLLMNNDDEIAAVFMANASGVNTAKYVRGMYDLVAPAVRAAAKRAADARPTAHANGAAAQAAVDLRDFVGSYSSQPWGGETAIVLWEGGLAMLGLPTAEPRRGLTRLEHIADDTFRRVRRDEQLGEAIVFERDASGRVTGYRQHGNLSPRRAAPSSGQEPPQAGAAAVRATVGRLFDGMRERDRAKLASTFHAGARLFGVGPDGQVRETSASDFIESIMSAPEHLLLDEVLDDVEIRSDGPLASIWTYYDFFAGENFSHCGYNAFQLLETAGEWKIVAVSDSRRRDGCRQQRRPGGEQR
jgi:CubicO group peptidase (beta-lactamase class C family)